MHRLICLFLLLSIGLLKLHGQVHKWAFDIQNASGLARITSQAVDDSSNIYIAGVFQGTMYLGNDTFTFASTTNFAIFYAKYTKDGNYVWGNALTSAQSANISEVIINSQGQIILFGNYTNGGSSSISFGNVTLSRSAAVFVAFLNSSGTFTDAKDLAYGSFTTAIGIELGPNDELITAMYLNGFGVGWNIVDGSSTTSGTGFVYAVAKYNPTASSLTWSNTYSISNVTAINAIDVDPLGQVYFTCRAAANISQFGITTPSTGRSSYVVWLDSSGNLKQSLLAYSTSSAQHTISQIEVLDSFTIYIAGHTYADSLTIGNSTIYGLANQPNSTFNWVAELKNFDTLSWKVSTSPQGSGGVGNNRLSINGDFLYVSSIQNSNNFSFGGFSSTSYVASMVSKLDRLGNVLWYLPINSTSTALLSAIENQDLVYSGRYTGSLSLSPFSFSNTGSVAKPFVARTFDYSITRGQVRAGPYCAGDTLLVPYLKVGDFDTSNVFKAEISDEEGNFLGGQRELGRLKTTRDSTILGFLPLFQVASSGKYRIRVTSSSPVVQSYYKLDTLNLLIYSRDKADPGPDTLICFGDTIRLNTFGGTRWRWSPAFAMEDSTLRNPRIWPRTDTLYTIIISDSSGCGLADTADIRVRIRSTPQFTSQTQSDTIVCKNTGVKLFNTFNGGLNQYYLTWRREGGSLLKSTQTSDFTDSLEVFPTATTRYLAILTDSCSITLDSAFYTVQVFDTMQVSQPFTDTLICIGGSLRLAIPVNHPRMDSIGFVWQELGNASILSTDSSYQRVYDTARSIQVTVNNRCNQETKDYRFQIQTYPSLTNTIQALDTRTFLCDGDSIRVVALPQGGRSNANLQTRWELHGFDFISDTLLLYADSLRLQFPGRDTFTLRSIVTDDCTTPDDTAFYGFRLFPKLKIDSITGLESRLCYIQNQQLLVNGSGGLGAPNYFYSWVWNGEVLDTNARFILSADSFPAGQNLSIQAVIRDQCSIADTSAVQFYIPEKPLIQILGGDTLLCSKESPVWKSQREGGDTLNLRYTWRVNGTVVSTVDSVALYLENSKIGEDSLLWLSVSLSDSCSPQVASDSIRIRISPNPISSFKNDSLAYRQYSDTTLCRGESITLLPKSFYTSNGLPATLVRNGLPIAYSEAFTLSNTTNIPEDSVVFWAIAQSDCGTNADTATYVVYLRDALELAPMEDSLVCANTQVIFEALANGGLGTANYSFTWYDGAKAIATGSSLPIVADSFQRGQSSTIGVIVEDGCSLADTVSFQLFIPSQPQIAIGGNDTALCSGSSAFWTSYAQGGQSANYTYSWRLNGVPFSSDTSITRYFEHARPGGDSLLSLSVRLWDACALDTASDSLRIRLAPNPIVSFGNDSLNVRQIQDTLICRGEVINLQGRAFYNLLTPFAEIYVANNLVSTNGSYQLSNTAQIASDTVLIYAINPGNCGVTRDTATYIVRLREPLQLEAIADSQVCANAPVSFTAQASGGLSSNYLFTWIDRGSSSILAQGPTLNLAQVDQALTIEVKLEDQCTTPRDSVAFKVSPLDTLSIRLSSAVICADTIQVSTLAQGGRNTSYAYTWTWNEQVLPVDQSSYSIYPDTLAWVKVELGDGCSAKNAMDSLLLSEKMRFRLNFTEDSVCEPFSSNWTMEVKSKTPMEFSWRESRSNDWQTLAEVQTYPAGNYAFIFLAENSLGCRDSINKPLVVKPKPVADFSWSPALLDQDKSEARISTALNADGYSWRINDTLIATAAQTIRYDFQDSGNYLLSLIVDLKGCLDTAERLLRVEEAFRYYEVTAFTPNGDRLNDTYIPYVKGNIEEMSYSIFNSWGQKIFEGDLQTPWEGTHQGTAVPTGYYMVLITVTTKEGQRDFFKSVVHLIR